MASIPAAARPLLVMPPRSPAELTRRLVMAPLGFPAPPPDPAAAPTPRRGVPP